MKYKLLIIAIYIVLEIVTSFFRAISFQVSSAVTFTLYFVVTVVLICKFKDKISADLFVVFAVMGIMLFNLPFTVFYFEETMISRLDEIIRLLSVVAGYGFAKISGRNAKVIYTVICFVIGITTSIYGNKIWVRHFSPCDTATKTEDSVEVVQFGTEKND